MRFLPCCRSGADVVQVFKSLHSSIEELGRNNHRTTAHPTRGDLDRLTLRGTDVVTLLATELGESRGYHASNVLLVQDVNNVETTLARATTDHTLNRNSTTFRVL